MRVSRLGMGRLCPPIIFWMVVRAGISLADDPGPRVTLSGQVRPRLEVQDFRDGLRADTFTSMRVRAGITGQPAEDVKVAVQFQDVRLWGEETNTLADYRADNFDLYQGYFELSKVGGKPLSLRVGRQALAFSEERLVGAVDWTPQARALDGLRATCSGKGKELDLFLMKLREDTSTGRPANSYLGGAYARISRGKGQTLDLYALYDRVAGRGGLDRLTAGVYWSGKRGRVDYRLEVAHQAGDLAGSDINANLAAITAGLSFGKRVTGRVALWYDYLSGDDDPVDGRSRVFNTLFATNHKFYGFADYFLNIPTDTRNAGLRDLALKLSLKPEKRLTVAVDVHGFWTAGGRGLPSRRLGQEADLTLTLAYRKGVTVTAGCSRFFVGGAMTVLRGLKEDGNWAYAMTNVSF